MRNLRNIGHSVVQFSNDLPPCTATAWDTNNDCLICAFGPTAEQAFIELRRIPKEAKGKDGHGNGAAIAAWDAPCPNPSLDHDRILSLHHFGDTLTTCLVLAGGDIVLVREEPQQGEEAVEIVGTVDAGIAAATWSPDEELLAVITAARTLLLMTRRFESTVDVPFSSDDMKVSSHVSVGWGKAETQFKGKRAKALRDPTVPEHVDEGLLTSTDDGTPYVSWRGDGAYLAVSSVENGKRRMIRVYSREGALDSVSEPVDHLEGPIAWRPAGNLIAAFQHGADQSKVIFFERNGLRHGEFNLVGGGSTDSKALSLAWNVDSSVLSVTYADRTQLWTMGNYHYYLKQEILHRILPQYCCSWHPERPLRLAISISTSVETFDYAAAVSRSPPTALSDPGTVAVIDGTMLKLTPLRFANVPPPMSLHEIDVLAPIIDVAFDHSGSRFMVMTSKGLSLYAYDYQALPVAAPTCVSSAGWENSNLVLGYAHRARQILLDSSDHCRILITNLETGDQSVVRFEQSTEVEAEDFNEAIVNLVPGPDTHGDHRLGASGQITALSNRSGVREKTFLSQPAELRLPPTTMQVELAEANGELIAFGLTSGGSIFANSRLLARNCTSFIVTAAHLIFTTNQHLLKFVHLTNVERLEVPPDAPETDERCRSIERGARIITVIPSSYGVVLQMPRGNLETIYPRALVLANIRQNIDDGNYKRAFLTCRNQRVDLNILHDHGPAKFMKSVPEIIRQLRKPEYIDLLLAALRDEDVSQTMYLETLQTREDRLAPGRTDGTTVERSRKGTTTIEPGSKVNRICDAFLAELSSQSSHNLRNIITAHVCKSPPDLASGLTVISKLREQGLALAERGAEHICFLADATQLYNEALGLYDLELAILIAQQAQKDPREYLPYLQNLQSMTELRRKYSIDHDLGRYVKALGHLHTLGAFDELKRYMQKHELYAQALELFRYQEQQLKELMRPFADFLSGRNRFQEAAVAYEYLEDYQAASEAFRQANMWQEALSSATLVPFSPEDLQSLARDLANSCEETKNYQAAAIILRDYLSDPQGAVRLFCRSYHISEAIRLVGLQQQPTWLESIVDPGLADGMASMTEMLGECREQLRLQVPRLRELREKKAMDPLAFYGGEPAVAADGIDIPDNISLAPTDASTAGTFMTRYTNRSGTINTQTSRKTSKNRRREERKRARGKKGTVYEEEYLLNSITRLIERVNSIAEDVQRLVEGLMRRKMRERAAALEQVMMDVVVGCKECIPEVFQVDGKKDDELRADAGENQANGLGERPLGPEGVLWDAMDGLGKKLEPPVLKDFVRLTLLGG